MLEKVHKKFRFWNSLHILLAMRVIVISVNLTFTFWFLINVWGGYKKVVNKCKIFNRSTRDCLIG
jgi:hypothetical protein